MSIAKKIHKKEGEEITLEVRRYVFTYIPYYLIGFAFLFATSFFMFRIFAWGWIGDIVYALGMFIGLCLVLGTWFFYRQNVLVVTSERIIDITRSSWFDEEISSVSHLDIRDISVRKRGVLQNLLNYGTLQIQTRSSQYQLDIIRIKNPQSVQTFILEASHKFRHDRKLVNNEAIYNNFIKIIPELTDPQLHEVHRLISSQFANSTAGAGDKEVV